LFEGGPGLGADAGGVVGGEVVFGGGHGSGSDRRVTCEVMGD
jgi:hypothetical protein